jgi:excisionase family DNA binding protein
VQADIILQNTRRTQQQPDDLLDSHQVASWLRVTLRTVYRWKSHGGLPYRKIGGRLRYSRVDVEAWYRGQPARLESTNGALMTPLEPINAVGAPTAHPSAPHLDELNCRLQAVEAFVATMRQQPRLFSAPNGAPSAHPSAPKRTWLKRGTHLATDMADALHDYAKQHRLEIREVLDLALREFFAHRGGAGKEVRNA